MDVTVVTTARTDEQARELLRMMGLPLRDQAGEDVAAGRARA
jgi:ribosomal protein L5